MKILEYIETEKGCHEYKKYKLPNGYGQAWYQKRNWLAHRLQWFLNYGELSNLLNVCHKCDNPACINVDHLFLGTQKENIADMRSKNRKIDRFGDNHAQVKLLDFQVQLIRENKENKLQRELAKEYNVSRELISAIQRNKKRIIGGK